MPDLPSPRQSRDSTEDPVEASLSRSTSLQLRHRFNTPVPNPTVHPLSLATVNASLSDDASRPTLRRLVSETERQVAESSRSGSDAGSLRGSFDLLRMSPAGTSAEVEVLLHQVRVERILGFDDRFGKMSRSLVSRFCTA